MNIATEHRVALYFEIYLGTILAIFAKPLKSELDQKTRTFL